MSTLDTLAGSLPTPTSTTSRPPQEKLKGIKEGEYVDVAPYDARDPNADKFLPWFWNKLKSEGLVDLYFPGSAEDGFCDFVKLMSGPTRVVLVVIKSEEKKEIRDVVGLATWDALSFGVANVGMAGFIFFREFWDRHTTAQAARRIMKLWFDELKLDALIGIVARDNVLANAFMRKVGWTLKCELPRMHVYLGKPSDACLWYVGREEFERGGE